MSKTWFFEEIGQWIKTAFPVKVSDSPCNCHIKRENKQRNGPVGQHSFSIVSHVFFLERQNSRIYFKGPIAQSHLHKSPSQEWPLHVTGTQGQTPACHPALSVLLWGGLGEQPSRTSLLKVTAEIFYSWHLFVLIHLGIYTQLLLKRQSILDSCMLDS